jgi:hypothetical protein
MQSLEIEDAEITSECLRPAEGQSGLIENIRFLNPKENGYVCSSECIYMYQ